MQDFEDIKLGFKAVHGLGAVEAAEGTSNMLRRCLTTSTYDNVRWQNIHW